ncbi:hypothetical protein J31TS4_02960 [Paenibacillus sp. J31TS4]|uniref:PstS family phosphate ABC transporter substrate-binding protein n=1 Tax=Paenibacillus sp. J31TS4 TaxID=2807195 RepID=UPI001B211A6E|nr:substrate-binding domain-containing protein [Paenibacillus sp. J31TS4]GIP37016.1 hypothetical protein J31TS4_02960 [Paenibacillus sp. J31TS4]
MERTDRLRPFWLQSLGRAAQALAWGLLFCLLYLLVSGIVGTLLNRALDPLLEGNWSDPGLLLLVVLFVAVHALVYACLGALTGRILPRAAMRWTAALLPALAGCLIWLLTMRTQQGALPGVTGIAWLPYNLYVAWASEPLWELLAHYVTGDRDLKLFVLAFSFVPSLSYLYGARLGRLRRMGRIRPRTALLAAAGPLALLLLLFGVAEGTAGRQEFTLETLPRLDGATAAIPFGGVLVGELTGVNRVQAAQAVHFTTTHPAYLNLINGKADLIFVAGPSEEERRLAAAQGVELKLIPVGMDAFLFLVHRENPVDGLTSAQVRDIYTGDIGSWREVGGEDSPIVAFQRDENSGSQTFMQQKVMAGLALAEPPTIRRITGMGGLIESVADYRNAKTSIGYSFLFYAKEMNRHEDVKFLAIDGVPPSQEAIRQGTYPFTAQLYAVSRAGEPEDGPVGRILAWLQSPAGRKAVERGGFVPLQPQ